MQINLEFRALNSMLWDTDGVVCLSSQGKGRKAEKLNPFTGLRQDGNPLIPPPILKELKKKKKELGVSLSGEMRPSIWAASLLQGTSMHRYLH